MNPITPIKNKTRSTEVHCITTQRHVNNSQCDTRILWIDIEKKKSAGKYESAEQKKMQYKSVFL